MVSAADLAKAAQLELDSPATANDQGQKREDQEDLASRSRVSQSLCCGNAGVRRGLFGVPGAALWHRAASGGVFPLV